LLELLAEITVAEDAEPLASVELVFAGPFAEDHLRMICGQYRYVASGV
jgi:hypothetical protein